MTQLDIDRPEIIPLHRLLKRREVEDLLGEFAALTPGADLALIRADGSFFAGTGEWSQAKLAEMLTQIDNGQPVDNADFILQPLQVKSFLVGALAVRDPHHDSRQGLRQGSGQDPAQETVLRCLHQSLKMLLVQALAKRDIAQETLERYREINLLYQVGETIGACLNPVEIPQLVLTAAKGVIHVDVGVVLLPVTDGEGELEVKNSFGTTGQVEGLRSASQQLVDQALLTGRPDIVTPLSTASIPVETVLCAPLKARDRVLGVVLLGRTRGRPMFTASDEKLVMALASQAAIAIEKAWLHQQEVKQQRLEKELAVGRQIQLSLLPESCPTVPGWEFAAFYQAARQIGGDLYDFFELPGEPHRLGLIIADVTGKGVPAALFMAFCRTIIRAGAMTGQSPSAVLERANRSMVRDSRARLLLSAFYATLDTGSGRLAYANAGHNRPVWFRSTQDECQKLAARGILLGAFDEIRLEEQEDYLAPGDFVVFYTDGVTEAMAADQQLYGEKRLRTVVKANSRTSAKQVLQAIVDGVRDFTGETAQSDDFTLFVVRRQEVTTI